MAIDKANRKEWLITRHLEYSLMEEIPQLVSGDEKDRFAQVLILILNETMKIERPEALGAEPYERAEAGGITEMLVKIWAITSATSLSIGVVAL